MLHAAGGFNVVDALRLEWRESMLAFADEAQRLLLELRSASALEPAAGDPRVNRRATMRLCYLIVKLNNIITFSGYMNGDAIARSGSVA